MEFASLHFLLFLVALLLIVRSGLLNHMQQKILLLAASYYFYACWDWRFTGLLLLATVITYWSGVQIAGCKTETGRKATIAVLVAMLLGILFYFKYANFFIENFKSLLDAIGWKIDVSLVQLILPIGISFFTFQCLSYGIDVYRGHTKVCRRPLDFALYIAFFPTLLSGPITRAHQLLPQLSAERPPRSEDDMEGLALVLRGFVKKIVFADLLGGQLVGPAFDNPSAYSSLFLLVAVYAYSFQIYMDLSGYTDIARGVASALGYRLPINFNRPYLATSVSNFWQRWHISMSSFFRDYLYFGLGGSKHGNVYVNLLVTFVCIGFWHGASWGFIVYGLIHGLCVSWERWGRSHRQKHGQPDQSHTGISYAARIFLVFNIIAFSRVLFRAGDLVAATNYFSSLLSFADGNTPWRLPSLIVLLLSIVLHYLPQNWSTASIQRFSSIPVILQATTLILATLVLGAITSEGAPFLYFQF